MAEWHSVGCFPIAWDRQGAPVLANIHVSVRPTPQVLRRLAASMARMAETCTVFDESEDALPAEGEGG